MAEIPSANVTVSEVAGAGIAGTGILAIFAAVAKNADVTPRVFASPQGILDQHNYSQGASYAASHIGETRKPVLFVGLPIATPGAVGRVDNSGVLGTSAIAASAAGTGVLDEADVVLRVTRGGTVGTDQILLALSCDGGETFKTVRLGAATNYTVPQLGIVFSFGAGKLELDDEFTCSTTAPKWDAAGITAARLALAAQKRFVKSVLVVGDLANVNEANTVRDEMNLYETSNQRFTRARVQLRDRLPLAAMSKITKRMTGTPTLTFAATGKTVTRSSGSWLADELAVGDVVSISGSTSNNVTSAITALTATVMTLGGATLVDEGPKAGCSVVGSAGITFAAAGKTVTRSSGSWLADRFTLGDTVTIAGSASNNLSSPITALTSTVMTLGGATLTNETARADFLTITKGETKAAWISFLDAAYASIDAQKRIGLGVGRRRKTCPITGWSFRRPAQWAACLREYTLRDIHIATWRKGDGPLSGWGSDDLQEYDDLTDGGASSARFTSFRSWSNGPEGAFISLDLTRMGDDSLLSYTHNVDVVNLACTVVQSATEMAIGESLVLNRDGTATQAALGVIEGRVNRAVQQALLQDNGEGPRASSAVWTASRSDVLNVANAKLHGVLSLNLRGTLVHIDTNVVVQSSGG
jgi:hypothetical protein